MKVEWVNQEISCLHRWQTSFYIRGHRCNSSSLIVLVELTKNDLYACFSLADFENTSWQASPLSVIHNHFIFAIGLQSEWSYVHPESIWPLPEFPHLSWFYCLYPHVYYLIASYHEYLTLGSAPLFPTSCERFTLLDGIRSLTWSSAKNWFTI